MCGGMLKTGQQTGDSGSIPVPVHPVRLIPWALGVTIRIEVK